MTHPNYEFSELLLTRINELRDIQKKVSLAEMVESLLSTNEALKEIIFEEDLVSFSKIFTNGKDGKSYSKSDEVRLKAIDLYRKNLDLICKITSIPLQLITSQGINKDCPSIQAISPLALPSSDDNE